MTEVIWLLLLVPLAASLGAQKLVRSTYRRYSAVPNHAGLAGADARAAGLSASEAERRLAEVGANTIEEANAPSPARRLAANFVQPVALGAEELRKAVVRRRMA